MPAIDHDERRRKIAQIAVDLIAREGLDAATVRRIAAEVGYSTTVVTHYFADKNELLMWAFRFVAREANEQFDQILARDRADVIGTLLAMTAADDASIRRWRVYVAFWHQAAVDPLFAAEQKRWIDGALRRIADQIRARYGDRADVDRAAKLLIALVQGISVQALFDPDAWSREQIRQVLASEVERALGASTP